MIKSSLLYFAVTVITLSLLRVDATGYRLPNNTRPLHYDLKLIPYLDNNVFTFDGEVDIDVTVVEQTSSIILHAYQLEIDSNNVNVTSENIVPVISNIIYDNNTHFYSLIFATALTPGNYSIHIKFTGQLQNDLKGFYRSYYSTSSGEIRWYASTFFAPIYARQAFPCFDEPGLKAQFTISIAHWPNQIALSNSFDESVSLPDATIGNRVWTKFYTTPLMSTYLVAFMVSDFEHVANTDGTFRIWSRSEALSTASHSLGGLSLLNALSTFTGINYNSTFPKMDQVALPEAATTAMENWGLVTYREPWILWQDDVSSTRDKQNIATVTAHEFAHQWFGNLVTPAWWDYVWLSEGFATYFEYYIADEVNPSWRLMEQFVVNCYHTAMMADSSDTTRQINGEINTPNEISNVYDLISYYKGASIIRMLSTFVSEPVFQRGLQIYLANNSYETGTPDKLWDAIKEANELLNSGFLIGHVDIKTVMDTWTNQKGYPVINVVRNYTTNTQVLTQEPFLLKGRGSSTDTTQYRWWIPLNYASQTSPNFINTRATGWIRAQDESVMVSGFLATDWVIFNVQQAGYYRVNYDEQNWNMIIEYLKTSNFTDISPVTRAQLIDDAFNLARAGYLKYSVPLSLSRYLNQETDYIPWTAAFNTFGFLYRILVHSPEYTKFQSYFFSLVAPIHNSLGYINQENDEHVTRLFRTDAHTWACRLGCPGCNSQAQQLLADFHSSEGNSVISEDLRGWAFCHGLRPATIEVWDFIWSKYLASDVASEQAMYISSLGCSANEEILNRYLSFSITNDSGLRSHDRLAVFNSVYLSNPSNVDIALKFLQNNIEAVSNYYGGINVVGSLLENLAVHLVSDSQLASLQTLISEHIELGEASAAVQRAVAIAVENIAWLGTYENDITEWLNEELPSSGNSLVTLGPLLLVFVHVIFSFLV